MENFNVLSIDGGGIKGLRSLFVVKELERRTGTPAHEIFNLMAGTSTGGIIAALLALGYSCDEVIALYMDHGSKIFKKRWWRRGWIRPQYSDRYLNKVLRKYLKENRLSNCKSHLIVPAYNIETRDKVLFKTSSGFDYTLFDVVRSTVSAQSYFKPHKIHKQRYIDGGNVINNPSMVAYVEYKKVWSDKQLNMLSIGTGREESSIKKRKGGGGLLQWAKPTVDILMIEQAQQTDYFMAKLEPHRYIRIEPVSAAGDTRMDNASLENMLLLKGDGEQTVVQSDALITSFVNRMGNS